MKSVFSCLLLFAFCSSFTLAQAPSPESDPAAVQAITLAAQRSGLAVRVPLDLLATGNVLLPSGVSVPVVIKQKGKDLIRAETGGADPGTVILNLHRGRVIAAGGTRDLSFQTVVSMQYAAFPLLRDILLPVSAVTVKELRQERISGNSYDRVALAEKTTASDPASPFKERFGAEAWFDSVTGLLERVSHGIIGENDPWTVSTYTRVFSDYRTVGNLTLPFREDRYLAGEPQSSIQLDSVSLDVGLSDEEFSISAEAKPVQ